jgi:molecular chaperone GrpE (heat shock protein)
LAGWAVEWDDRVLATRGRAIGKDFLNLELWLARFNLTGIMTERSELKMAKWPFFLIDVLFLGLAAWIISRSGPIAHFYDSLPLILCVGGGAAFLVYPFVMDYQAALKFAEQDGLTTTVQQIQNLETVAAQIATATNHWQSALDQSSKTVTAADQIAARMNAEIQGFTEFMAKASESEKAHLKLEVDKLRRAEGEWLQVLVRILDQVYGLHQAGVRSGQPNIMQQLGSFQNLCRDAARRIGLVPFAPQAGEALDAARHQLLDENATVPASAVIGETVGTGYTFQGQLLRRAIVTLREAPAEPAVSVSLIPEASPEPGAQEPQLL